MTPPWLDVVGIGEAGLAGLSPAARAALESAGVIVGGDRFPALPVAARRLPWPKGMPALAALLRAERMNHPVMLVTGDPLWYSVGARILSALPGEEIRFHPALSVFQLCAARLRWSLADLETLALLRRPPETAIPFFAPGARLLMVTEGAKAPPVVARLLTEAGYGASRMVVLSALGGKDERVIEGEARSWSAPCPDFLTLAVECRVEPGAEPLPRILPDEALAGLEASPLEARAAALAFLWPRRGARLIAEGPGAAALAIDWLRAARDAEATVIGPDDESLRARAAAFGAPRLAFAETAPPADAAFFAGPEAEGRARLAALKPGGRLLIESRGWEEGATARIVVMAREGELRLSHWRLTKGWETTGP
ncbi:MAG: precorrin-6y C5,15-methyltransferase (decarboxylating) subunit CbiE [Pikeienuella sp.]|uniref:precorrin-6y C5,15-methyltransferase (decarboxylating) subunit CbiE n=1 Tax=Pikeienuella sp. TaxID=2831957 RepID=UPI00391D6716